MRDSHRPFAAALHMAVLLALVQPVSAAPPPPIEEIVMEAYPDGLQAALEARDRFLVSLPAEVQGVGLEQVFRETTKWTPGRTITVAFLGGDPALHKDIAEATKDWTDICNVKLDFGLDPATGQYRSWSTNNQDYKADIRVAFDHPGYWSLVGNDSRNSQLGRDGDGGGPSQRSLNLSDFITKRPTNWRSVVLHEFGHALGFSHEHQHPTQGCDADFRWNDDSGYIPTKNANGGYIADPNGKRPGIYTVLGGPPNSWPQSKVDHNLRQIPDSHAYYITAFDKTSIMKYSFPPWMFVNGADSHCFSAGTNTALSPDDRAAAAKMYPTQADAMGALMEERRSFLKSLTAKPLNSFGRRDIEERLKALQ